MVQITKKNTFINSRKGVNIYIMFKIYYIKNELMSHECYDNISLNARRH